MFFYKNILLNEFEPFEYMSYLFLPKESFTLAYVCLKLVKKLTESHTFYLNLFIAIDQKGKEQENC